MSTSLPNPKPGSTDTESAEVTRRSQGVPASQAAPAPGFETLQALLAFSSLHEQIRQRRVYQEHGGTPLPWAREEPFRFDEMLQMVAERALTITGADGVAIALAEDSKAFCRASAGRIAPPVGAELDPYAGFSGICFRTGEIVRCDDSENDPRVDVEACRTLGTRAMVAVPVLGRDYTIGIIEAFSSEAYGFNDSDIRSLNLLAELVLAAIEPGHEPRAPNSQVEAPPEEPKEDLTKALEPLMPSLEDVQAVLKVHERHHTVLPTEELSPEPEDLAVPFSNPHEVKLPWLRPALFVLAFLIVLGVGATIWWEMRLAPRGAGVNRKPVSEPTSAQQKEAGATAMTSPESQTSAESQIADSQTSPAADTEQNLPPAEKAGPPKLVNGIRHWSSVDSSTVVVDLQDQVQYEAHRLTDPERIYFDLNDTTLAPGVGHTVEIGDALLVRVRLAQLTPTITRVVLETKGSPNFSVSLEPHPYRLVVEVRKIGSVARSRMKLDLFAPLAPEPSVAMLTPGADSSARRLAHGAPLRIALDAGHGGWDLGTVGRSGLLEKDLTLDIVARLGLLLEKRLGAEVIYTRQDDTYVPLEKRTEIANLSQADVFLSVHANYSDDTAARGVETYYTNTYSSLNARGRDDSPGLREVDWTNVDIRAKVNDSRRFALDVQRSLYHNLERSAPGIRNRGVKKASYVVLTGTTMPAILAEVSFVSSPADEASLQSSAYRQQIAEALFEGVAGYKAHDKRLNIATATAKSAGMH